MYIQVCGKLVKRKLTRQEQSSLQNFIRYILIFCKLCRRYVKFDHFSLKRVSVCVCVCVCRSVCCDRRNGSREVWERLIDSSAGQLALTEVRK